MNKEKIKMLSLFSGIGAFEKALTRKKIDYEVVAYCENNKYASAAYSAIHNIPEEKNLGDISTLDISKLPDCDLITYGFPCFVGGTLVLTNKGYKKIEDIVEGDMVLTHTNTFKKVLKIMDKDTSEYYSLETFAAENINVTKNHPLYVRKVSNKNNEVVFSEPTWVKVKDLSTEYYIGAAINKESIFLDLDKYDISEIHQYRIKKMINKEEFWWLLGKWISNKIIDDNQLAIVVDEDIDNSTNTQNYAFVLESLIEDRLNTLEIPYKREITEDNSYYIIDNPSIVHLFNKFCKEQKSLFHDITLLPENLIRNFLNGFLITNNYVSKKGETIIKLTTPELVYSLVQSIAKAYKTPYRINKIDKSFYITIFKEDNFEQDSFYENGYVWFPINKISRIEKETIVYNMEVEEDNSYTIFNLIAHNCQDISNAGLKKGIIKDKTRSGLLFYALDIIREKKPKYAICENVKNLVGKKFKQDFDNLLKELDDMGYNNYWKVINANDHGIPQSRERVFVISIRKDLEQEYSFPKDVVLDCKLNDILQKNVDEIFYLSEKSVKKLQRHNNKIINGDTPNISSCIHAGYYKMGGRDQQYIKIKKTYSFPIKKELSKELSYKLKNFLEEKVDDIYYIDQSRINILLKELKDKDCLAIREGVKKGYNEAYEGDNINIAYPKSIVKRGCTGKEKIQTLLTSSKICVVEKKDDKQSYLEKRLIDYISNNNEIPEFFNAYNQRAFNDVSPTLTAHCGSPTSINGIVKCEGIKKKNNIIAYNIPKSVRLRVYEVDKIKLQELLNERKNKLGLSCREISRRLNIQQSLVEHWFRGDDSFAIPHPEIWDKVKEILQIKTNEFDKSITTFKTKEGNYDKANRIYDVEGNIPTLTTTCKEHTIVDLETFKIRKLTPLEIWRLMGFDDEDYYKGKNRLIKQFYNGKDKTNSQMYKMAGNSIVVNVLEDLMENLFK